jgi:transposase
MSSEHFIALDTHCSFCEMAVVSQTGRILKRDRCETAIPPLVALLEGVRRPRVLTFEEGPLADWLARNLRQHVEKLIVCEPRRNALIAKDGDKDDPIDAEKLAQLLRGGFLKEVHQASSLDRALLKQHVSFYHDRVRERVRQGHQLVAQLRRHGVFASILQVMDEDERRRLYRKLPQRKLLIDHLELVRQVYELMLQQEDSLRAELVRLARREQVVRSFTHVPGISWIRAVTFYVYIDTPERFKSKSAAWRYCGIGLERRRSGDGPMRIRLVQRANRRLKNVLLGAAKSAAAAGDNPFADKYHYWTKEEGEHPSTARRNTARAIAGVLLSMWQNGSEYDPALVRGVGRPSQARVKLRKSMRRSSQCATEPRAPARE